MRSTGIDWMAGVIVAGAMRSSPPALAPKDLMPTTAPDPYAWLEDVTGDEPLAWVHAQNARTDAELADTPQFAQLEADIRGILDSDAKIPEVEKIGAYYYNFWKDARHEHGVWRRTTLAEYRKPEPLWETVIDLDALNLAEDENWVWHGADWLRPRQPNQTPQRCLIALSRGGSDADVTREFDLGNRQWLQDGFFRPEAKGSLGWIDRDTVYVATDFGPDPDGASSMTTSGYPRIAKQWRRGTPLASATLVYAGQSGDLAVSASHDAIPGFERDFVRRTLDFYRDELYLRTADGGLAKLDVPDSVIKSVHREWLALKLRESWTVADTTYAAGSLLATRFDDFMAGKLGFELLFVPTAATSLDSFTWTRHHLVLNVLDDVKNRLVVLTPDTAGWVRSGFVGVPDFGTLGVQPVDADDSDAVWLTATDYLTPSTLALAQLESGTGGQPPEVLKTMPAFFDASQDVIEQNFAHSSDGTKVPYFLVRPKNLQYDGNSPTLLYGYGGFEVSLTPAYSGAVGKGWLEHSGDRGGGVYVVANIRGGGEYGPRWHQAALKHNRHKAYEDFVAVAQDLVARGITSHPHLGIMGGSNGGLLVGNMLTQYPDLFGAVVVQVPLLDMKRYSHLLAGASWMAEYGDPDTQDWSYLEGFSPYHLFDVARDYPPTFLWTTTRDDRVHPAHARKMAAKMLAADKDVRYYENTEGGHGAGATNQQIAHLWALTYRFLWQQLQ